MLMGIGVATAEAGDEEGATASGDNGTPEALSRDCWLQSTDAREIVPEEADKGSDKPQCGHRCFPVSHSLPQRGHFIWLPLRLNYAKYSACICGCQYLCLFSHTNLARLLALTISSKSQATQEAFERLRQLIQLRGLHNGDLVSGVPNLVEQLYGGVLCGSGRYLAGCRA